MNEKSVETAVVHRADILSGREAAVDQDLLIDQITTDQNEVVPATETEVRDAIERLSERGFLKDVEGQPGFLSTDQTAREADAFARAVTDPKQTNVFADPSRAAIDPMAQAQRYTIVDRGARGGDVQTLNTLLNEDQKVNAIAITGQTEGERPDLIEAGIETSNVVDFVTVMEDRLATNEPYELGYGPETVMVITQDATSSARNMEALAQTAETLGVGKVLIMDDPATRTASNALVVGEAIRSGAVAETPYIPVNDRETITTNVRSTVERTILSAETVEGQTLETVAVELANEQVAQMEARDGAETSFFPAIVATDPVRLSNLEKAATSRDMATIENLTKDGSNARVTMTADTLQPVRNDLVNTETGAGLRSGDILTVNSAGTSENVAAGDVYRVSDMNPVDGSLVVQNAENSFVKLNVAEMAGQDVKLAVSTMEAREFVNGSPVSFGIGEDRQSGVLILSSAREGYIIGNDGEVSSVTPDIVAGAGMRTDYASASPTLTKDSGLVAVSGANDRYNGQGPAPGAAMVAARFSDSERGAPVVVVTDDPKTLSEQSEYVPSEIAAALENNVAEILGNGPDRDPTQDMGQER